MINRTSEPWEAKNLNLEPARPRTGESFRRFALPARGQAGSILNNLQRRIVAPQKFRSAHSAFSLELDFL
jgi:hypothetical protein